MGAKLALVMFVLMCAMGGGLLVLHRYTGTNTNPENNVKLETAVPN